MNIAKIKQFVFTQKIASVGIVLAAVLLGTVLFNDSNASAQTRYILGKVEKGTLMVTVSSTGQIEASDQIDVKPKSSAEVTSVLVAEGQRVKAGQALAYLDMQDAQQSVKNAMIALENAKITLQKLQRNQATDSTTAAGDLDQAYTDALNDISNAFLKLPDLIGTVRGILYDDTLKGGCSPNKCQYLNMVSDDVNNELTAALARAEDDYVKSREAYDATFADYRLLRHDASTEEIASMLDATKNVTELLAQAVKSEQNALDLVVDDMTNQAAKNGFTAKIPTQITTYQDEIGSAIGSLNSILSQLATVRRTIQNTQQSLENAELSNPLDLASQRNTVTQREDDVSEAKKNLANRIVRSPIDGVVAKVNIKRGDSASSGTAVATIVGTKRLVTVALNEVDIAKVAVGQQATVTFDAIENLTMTGAVASIDQVGTATQGVVNYDVTIALDVQDARVRPGMSVSANIATNVVQNALLVPNAAVKTLNGVSFVQAIDGATEEQAAAISGFVADSTPRRIEVQIGASNDAMTQIISGVAEGDNIVARTISGSSKTTTTSANTMSGRGGGSGGMQVFTR